MPVAYQTRVKATEVQKVLTDWFESSHAFVGHIRFSTQGIVGDTADQLVTLVSLDTMADSFLRNSISDGVMSWSNWKWEQLTTDIDNVVHLTD